MQEFIENAQKLKGPAKAIDMHRLVTKIQFKNMRRLCWTSLNSFVMSCRLRLETKLELILAQVLANTSSPLTHGPIGLQRVLSRRCSRQPVYSRESHGFASRMAAASRLGGRGPAREPE